MGEKLIVGPVSKGLRTDQLPFNIDNDYFPVLINAYQWRGRIKRKRGTSILGRLTRFFDSLSTSYNPGNTTQVLSGGGAGNLLTGFTSSGIQANASVTPGSITINDVTTSAVYTDPLKDGTLNIGATPNKGTIDYATGAFTILPAAADTVNANFNYYPTLPVLGLEDLVLNANVFSGTLAFDKTYSYFISPAQPYQNYSVSFYKNPPSGTINGHTYTAKTVWSPVTWNGNVYQQFQSTNYQGAFWVTNNNPGMQSQLLTSVTYSSATQLTIVVPANINLAQGDWIWINEVTGTASNRINQQTGFIDAAPVTAAGSTTFTATFPYANFANNAYAAGMVQYLTNIGIAGAGNGILWYDGDPTGGTPPTPSSQLGWVNFAPPLSQGDYSINDEQPDQYYLVGAQAIVPYKDRLLFIAPWIQTSSGTPILLQDTVIYSENGTPYYTASFDNSSGVSYGPQITYHAIMTPNFTVTGAREETAIPQAYWEDAIGFGGFISSGYAQRIVTVGNNEDVLILGFTNRQARFVYTGNDIVPFNFYIINSELGSIAPFSSITLDRGIMSFGDHGIVLTTQVGAERVDLQIPDQVFEINYTSNTGNGGYQITAQRDFINEWIYFTYIPENSTYIFPNQTLQYNYRDQSWAIFNESYTTYGQFRQTTGYTWATIGKTFPTWDSWNDPWESGSTNLLQPKVIAGNAQGYVVFRDQGTNEAFSLSIQDINGSTSVVTSPNHCLNEGDYVVIDNCLGTIGSQVNGKIFSVSVPATNTFVLNPSISAGTYLGSGEIKRMYVPFVQTKQFPPSWNFARKTRLGAQQYLLTSTENGQIELQIYLSENANNPYNFGPVVPTSGSLNNSLIYSDTLFTSPENYSQFCPSLPLGNIGNGVTLSFTYNLFTLFNFANKLVPGSISFVIGNVATFSDNGLGGFTATGIGTSVGSSVDYTSGIVTIAFYLPPNSNASTITFKYYLSGVQTPISGQQEQIWHRINTSLIGDTVQLGFTMNDSQMRDTSFGNQFSEIELHAFVIDLQPSQLLS